MPVNKSLAKKVFYFLLTGIVCLCCFTASAQNADTTKPKEILEHPKHSPKRAMLYSAICPGLGQIYNKKYWKLPILYAGLGTAVYFIFFNEHYYNMYNNQLAAATVNPASSIYSTAELSDLVNYYHRDRDLSIIISVGVYLINIVDANVDAQLMGFNVSDDISVHFSPSLLPNPMTGSIAFTPGFMLVKKFGR